MRTLRILAVLIFLCLSVVARPAIAGDVTVDRVVAAQFSFGYFIAVVVAHGTADLVNAQLSVNGTAIVADNVREYVIDPEKNLTAWTIVKYAHEVVTPGDVLTATVSDIELGGRSEEHTSELQSLTNLVCRLLLEKKKIEIKDLDLSNQQHACILCGR